jgi:DNA-binding transcriptional ArsR family regulator
MLDLSTNQEATLDALGSPMRRQIVRLLAPGPMSVGEIAAKLPVSRPAVSKHLRVLEGADLVRHRSQGNRNLFQLDQTGFDAARHWLDGFWDEALSRLAAAAGRQGKRSTIETDR